MTPLYNPIASSTFLDAFGATLYSPAQYATLAGGGQQPLEDLFAKDGTPPTITPAPGGARVTIGLVLDRASDPTAMLSGNWAERQAVLGSFATPAALWNTYGASQAVYDATVAQVTAALGGNSALVAATAEGYQSSAANRTIWVDLTPTEFQLLFGRPLLDVNGTLAWTGNLGLNDGIAAGSIVGLAIQAGASIPSPQVSDRTAVDLPVGPLGIANASTAPVDVTPAAVAANYNFPLTSSVATGTVALLEPGLPGDLSGLFSAYNAYRFAVGLSTVAADKLQGVPPFGSSTTVGGELALDISIVAGAAPNSTQLLYSGGTYQGYQDAIFDTTNRPGVLSSSYSDIALPTKASPFAWAFNQLMIDGVLANVTVHRSGGDGGSSAGVASGGTFMTGDHASPHQLVVGGTSITDLSSALLDPTVRSTLNAALDGDPAAIFPLVAAGLKTLPSHLSRAAPTPSNAGTTLATLFESVWQQLSVDPGTQDGHPVYEVGYGSNETGGGGIASQVSIPGYQASYGLAGMTDGNRGAPDVAALSSGNSHYATLNSAYVGDTSQHLIVPGGGTSASAPLWASLTAQFNAAFEDQGLPHVGFYHDLLYTAAVVAPGAFNDIQLGNNVTSFYGVLTGASTYYNTYTNAFMVPTGQGYDAQPGYDLVTGLGTPNGMLLARALTAIAHAEVSFAGSPPLLEDNGSGGWQSGAQEGLLFQAVGDGATFNLEIGGSSTLMASHATASFAYTARMAQQVLQPDFDPALVALFDRQSQGASTFSDISDATTLSIGIDGKTGLAAQAVLSNAFGFADFSSGSDSLRVARPLAIAQTVGGASDQVAIVRLRQSGEDLVQLTLYRVDDMTGSIGGTAPGQAGYAEAAQARTYLTTSGASAIAGPGFGLFVEAQVAHVDAGDLVAMRLDNLTRGLAIWGFANGNETAGGQPVNHLWNYGLNTWGFEDTLGGGDRDFNDLIVQIDFTSAYGHGWLA